MKFVSFQDQGGVRAGLVDPVAGQVWPVDQLVPGVTSVMEAVERFEDIKGSLVPQGEALSLEEVRLLAPIPVPRRNVFCVGKNYYDHAHEFSGSGFDSSAASGAVPEVPIIFTKVPESVIGPADAIQYPTGVSDMLDYEAELTVIIGKGGRGISKADAYNHVWGYTIINDVTARDWQKRHKQWILGKSFDTFCPMGPWAVTADEVDPENMSVQCWVNGELRQNANTKDLIFDIPTIIESISAGITLYPGDLIATGTPAGVGLGFDPPKFMVPGDVVKIEIGGIGVLENKVK